MKKNLTKALNYFEWNMDEFADVLEQYDDECDVLGCDERWHRMEDFDSETSWDNSALELVRMALDGGFDPDDEYYRIGRGSLESAYERDYREWLNLDVIEGMAKASDVVDYPDWVKELFDGKPMLTERDKAFLDSFTSVFAKSIYRDDANRLFLRQWYNGETIDIGINNEMFDFIEETEEVAFDILAEMKVEE